MDRLRTFYNIAKQNNRKFVVNVNDAPFLEHLAKDPQLNVPTPNDEHIQIFSPEKSTRRKFEKEYLEYDNVITAQDLAKQQGQSLCAFSFWHFGALIDTKPTRGSLYIHSASEPFNDEGVSDKKRIDLWLDHYDLNRVQSHCSGHSKGQDLLDIVKDINSDMLFPIHTVHPESYKNVTDKITIVKEGMTYQIS